MLKGTILLTAALVLGGAAIGAGPAKHGQTKGKIDLATATANGHMKGLLRNANGVVIFKLVAKLTDATPATAPGVEGTIDGVLLKANGSGPFAKVMGKYKADANGKGVFEAVVLKPSPSGALHPIGKIAGKLHDPAPNGTPGPYQGFFQFQ